MLFGAFCICNAEWQRSSPRSAVLVTLDNGVLLTVFDDEIPYRHSTISALCSRSIASVGLHCERHEVRGWFRVAMLMRENRLR